MFFHQRHAHSCRGILVLESIDLNPWFGILIVRKNQLFVFTFNVFPLIQFIVLDNRWLDFLNWSFKLKLSLFCRKLDINFINFVSCIRNLIFRKCHNAFSIDKSLHSNSCFSKITVFVYSTEIEFRMPLFYEEYGVWKTPIPFLYSIVVVLTIWTHLDF